MAFQRRTQTCGELREAHIGQSVTLNGWVNSYRAYPDQVFVDLRDRYGITQVVCESDDPGVFLPAQQVRSEFVLAVEGEVRRCGFRVMRELCGHGVGRTIHEEPSVPNYHEPRCRSRLTNGLVITIEPIIAAGTGRGELQRDKWTIRTADGTLSAHYEHTIMITKDKPILLTA